MAQDKLGLSFGAMEKKEIFLLTHMKISIIIPVYNRKPFVERCLRSLLSQNFDDYEIIVVDDGSDDETKDFLRKIREEKIKVLLNNSNRGPAYSRNQGITLARGEILAFIDSDCEASKDWLQELASSFDRLPVAMIIAGKVVDALPKNYWGLVNKGSDFIARKEGFVKKALTCNMAVRRILFSEQQFDEEMAMAAAEDIDFALRAHQRGHKIYYTPRATVTHYRRSDFLATMRQEFFWGYWNAYVNIKYRKCPLISFGAWVLLVIVLVGVASALFQLESYFLVGIFFVYAFLVLYVSFSSAEKPWQEIIISYPGFLLKSISNSFGSLTYIPFFLKKRLSR